MTEEILNIQTAEQLTEEDRLRLEKFGPAIDRFTLMDNVFLMKYFQDNLKGVSFILQKLLNRDDVYASEVHIEHYIKNVHGRDVKLDVFARDETGKQYNIEIQRASDGAVPKRARFHSSMLDCAMLKAGDDFSALVETVVIFITEHDALHGGELIYHVDRVIKETGRPFQDAAHIIYVNASRQDDSAIGRLMHDFTCADPKDMLYPEVAEKAYLLKYNQKERVKMAGVLEELIAEERRQEREQNMGVLEELIAEERRQLEEQIAEERKKTMGLARKLLQEQVFSVEKIAELVELPVEDVRLLQD